MGVDDGNAVAVRDLVAQSTASVRANQRLLAASRHLIAASRRGLNSAFALSGSSDDDHLRATVRARLASGLLFPVERMSWAGYGSGDPCAVCDAVIGGAEVEYETTHETNGKIVVHLVCYMLWRNESEALRKRVG